MLSLALALATAPIVVRFLPADRSRATVTVTFRSGQSQVTAEGTVVDGRLFGITIPATATALTIETPVHAPCELAAPFSEPCELRALTIVEPFKKKQTGRLWFRAAGDEKASWKIAKPLSPDEGPGFALPEQILDVVLAPDNEAASLHLGSFPVQLQAARSVPDEVDPVTLVVRVVGPDGSALSDRPRVGVLSSDGRSAAALRSKAWQTFYEVNASTLGRDGELRISPLPRESLLFTVQATGYSGVTISGRGKARDGVFDAGVIRMRRPITLTVVLESAISSEERPDSFAVSVRNSRRAAGFLGSRELDTRAGVRLEEPVQFKGLSPGVWSIVLSAGGVAVGFKDVSLTQPNETIVMNVEMAGVEGLVRLRSGSPVPEAHVQIRSHNLTDGIRFETRTDSDGRFQGHFLHGGGVVDIDIFRDPSDEGETLNDIDPASEEARSLRVTLDSGAEIRVHVVKKETQKPIQDARVACLASALDGRSTTRRTNADGVATFGGLPPAEWVCEASAPGFVDRKTMPFRTIADGDLIERSLDLSATRTLHGVVIGPSGPASGVTVMGPFEASPFDRASAPPAVQSSATGQFEIAIPATQTTLLAFLAPGYRLDFVNIYPEDDDAQLTLTPRGTDSRIELATSDGRAVRGASWTLSRNGLRIPELVVWRYLAGAGCATHDTDSDGSVVFGGCLSAGNYRFVILDSRFDTDVAVSEPIGFPAPPLVRLTVFTKEMPQK